MRKRLPSMLALFVVLLLPTGAQALAPSRPVGIALARHAIEDRYSKIETKIANCAIQQHWTECEVSAVMVEEEGRGPSWNRPLATSETHTTETPLTWRVRVYVRDHRLLVEERPH
jgi:hypothetical protein